MSVLDPRVVLAALSDRLVEIAREIEKTVGGGGCSDFASYRHKCGIIMGLAQAATAVEVTLAECIKALDPEDADDGLEEMPDTEDER